jgi:hypothetical protein
MKNKIFVLVLIGIISLTAIISGCSSQVVTQYQCLDGSFEESIDLCSEVPDLEVKIEYQCYDGTFAESKSGCEILKEIEVDSLEESSAGEITIERIQVQLANLYPTRVTVKNLGKESLNPKFDITVTKGENIVCLGSPIYDEISIVYPGELKTGEISIGGCIFAEDGLYTLTVDVLDSSYNKLDSESKEFEVSYWGSFGL